MAFINEQLTPEQQKEFLSWKVKEPILGFGQIIKEVEMYPPFEWTIDKERNIYLIGSSIDRDYPDEKVFVFIWNNKNYIVQFNQSFEDDYTVVWSQPQKYVINNSFPYCTEKDFIDDLRNALSTYGAFGNLTDINQKCKTIIKF